MTPLALYVHVPFCTVKCGYCDFNAYAGLDHLKRRYAAALLAELRAWEPVLRGRELATVSFGGGTPGEFPAEAIAGVLQAAGDVAHIAPGAEISIEANPGTLPPGYLTALRSAGVTRLSIGAQSFDAAELRFLDRLHSPEATAAAVGNARAAGFASVSLDLIYGLPDQPLDAWRANIERAIALQPDHLSCYSLTIEEGTPLARHVAAGRIAAPDADVAVDQYELAGELLGAAGFRHYELSNWALPGHESRHNLAYWTDLEYLALGAGGHGYLAIDGQRIRYENIAHPASYVAALSGGAATPARAQGLPSPAVADAYSPAGAMAIADWLEGALRLVEGFDPAAFARRFGMSLDSVAGIPLAECERAGIVERYPDRVRLTGRGRSLHSEVVVRVMSQAALARP